MGLGIDGSPWDEYEWVRLEDFDDRPGQRYVTAALDALARDPLWLPGDATRVLLVDLDNLRVEPVRLRARMAMAVVLARQADLASFAGQEGSVRRARPALEEFAETAVAVGHDHNEADEALLAAAATVTSDEVQFLVVSNDGIFARLAARGPLVVLSPGSAALSDQLADAAERVVDLQVIEGGVAATR
ncbi:MAG: hypothetical protein QOE64_1115 [Frankiales bacterium]|nr:hypothetical protein [Frankiales bacterium]